MQFDYNTCTSSRQFVYCCRKLSLDEHVRYNHSGIKTKKNQKVCCSECGKLLLQRFLATHMFKTHKIGEPQLKITKVKVIILQSATSYVAFSFLRMLTTWHFSLIVPRLSLMLYTLYERMTLDYMMKLTIAQYYYIIVQLIT